jgi:TolB-like protein/Tfp pilus assembly protein PilF
LRGKKLLEDVYNARIFENVRQSIRLLDQAVTHDPTFLLAYCVLARANVYLYFLGVDHTSDRVALAERARDAASRLGSDRGETHLAAAWVAYLGYLDYETALREVAIAQRGLPNDSAVFEITGFIARRRGQWEECTKNLERAAELDPRGFFLHQGMAGTYLFLRRFPDMAQALDRALAVAPGDPTTRLARALVDFESRADTQTGSEAIHSMLTDDPNVTASIAEQWLDLALCRRDAAEMTRALASLSPEGMQRFNVRTPRSFCEGLVARARGDSATVEKAFNAARLEVENVLREQPDYAQAHCVLGMIDAALGRKESAIREGRRAVELLPVTKDAYTGAEVLTNLAITYAWVGEKDLALKQLEELVRIPSPISYGQLKLHPFWDPLRGDPRFEKLLEEAKKPVAFESPPPLRGGIAVLPFENLSIEPENAFFADGVQDEILNNLAKIADLKVISRTSVMQYKTGAKRNLRQIANELGVAHVVEGNVQRTDNRVRVSAQLIDANTDTHLWAESYDRPLGDVFAIQSEIAKAIAGQLQAKLSPAEKIAIEQPPTTNLVAYDRYVRAKKLLVLPRIPVDLHEAVRLLDQAVAYDPTFLLAYCELAHTHAWLYFNAGDHTPARLELAKTARDMALRLGPNRGEAHLAAAWVAYNGYRDYEKALTEVGIARRSLPNDTSILDITAHIGRRQGHWKQSTSDFEHAAELDPRSVWFPSRAAINYAWLRRFSKAAAWMDRTVAIEPGNPAMRFGRAVGDLYSRADTQPGYEAAQRIMTEDPSGMDAVADMWLELALCRRDPTEIARALASLPPGRHPFWEGVAARARNDATRTETAFTAARVGAEKIVREQPDDAEALSILGMIDAALGRKEDALREGRRAVELLPVTKDAFTGAELLGNMAVIYAWVGEKDLAFKQLEEVLAIPSDQLSYGLLRLHPYWDPLRGDPRFEQLLEKSKKPVAMQSL